MKPMKADVYQRDLNRLWHKSGVWSEVLDLDKGNKRQAFKASHGFRKLFKSVAEGHMKSLNVLRLMGHSAGVSGDSYYRPSEVSVLEDYKLAVPFLTVSAELRQKSEIAALEMGHKTDWSEAQLRAYQMEKEIKELKAFVSNLPALLKLKEVESIKMLQGAPLAKGEHEGGTVEITKAEETKPAV